MTRVVALIPDLLFGSNVIGALRAAGIEAQQVADVEAAAAAIEGSPAAAGDGLQEAPAGAAVALEAAGDPRAVATDRALVLVVDLTGELDGVDAFARLRERGSLGGVKTLAFYSHVEVQTRERALAAGFDLVVPRSRIAREGAALVTALASAES